MRTPYLDKNGFSHLWGVIEPKEPEEGGSDLSLVDTNEKYQWDSTYKQINDNGDTDSIPYVHRQTGGGAKVGNLEKLEEIVGGTVVWNQFVKKPTISSQTINEITVTNNDDGSLSISGTASDTTRINFDTAWKWNICKYNHKMLWLVTGFVSGTNMYNGDIGYFLTSSDVDAIPKSTIKTYITESDWNWTSALIIHIASGATVSTRIYINCIDLTTLFGSTIADYIYSLEQANKGDGVAFFRKFFPKDYYEYNPGELMSVSGLSEHKMVGFNIWDEEWEVGAYNFQGEKTNLDAIRNKYPISVLPDTTYYARCVADWSSRCLYIHCYDSDMNNITEIEVDNQSFVTPLGTRFINFNTSTYEASTTSYEDGTICINLSDPAKNGTYEPYKAHSYPLDDSLTLRGIPKLDSNNQLYFDGDRYLVNGVVERRYGFRSYQSGDESLTDAITDGTNTVYELANPYTEIAQRFQELQECDQEGTEEFVYADDVSVKIPVGHTTKYISSISDKVDALTDIVMGMMKH